MLAIRGLRSRFDGVTLTGDLYIHKSYLFIWLFLKEIYEHFFPVEKKAVETA
jgi:hypothetical protein